MKQYSDRFAVVVLICLKEIIFYISSCLSFCVLQIYELFLLVRSVVILPVTIVLAYYVYFYFSNLIAFIQF